MKTIEATMSLTPYKVTAVLLMKIYCTDSAKTIIERRDFCIVALKLIQSPDMKLEKVLNILYSPEYMLQRFACKLKTDMTSLMSNGVEGLMDLFTNVGKLMKPGEQQHQLGAVLLNKNSVLGLYVRRMCVLFEKLTFSQVVSLHAANLQFCRFFQDAELSLEEELSSTNVLKKPEKSKEKKSVWGGRQAELLVAQQAHALQTDEHKALKPMELQNLVKELLSSSPHYAEAHYLSYLNCLRVNEYCGALDSLYHCFDRSAPLDSRNSAEDRSRTFRYAALNLAALHARFNHTEVAAAALKEAVMMAQEAGDNVCLQLAHAWMHYLNKKQNRESSIERSVGKASVLGITHTTSLSLITSAHEAAMEAKSPQHVFEVLMKSDVLNCQHSLLDLMSISCSEKAALWAYYGKVEMSAMSSQLLLLQNTGERKQKMFNGPSTCQAVVNIANVLIQFGDYELVEVVHHHAKERFPNTPCDEIWMLSEQLFYFIRAIRRENWGEAEGIAINLLSLNPTESRFRQAEVCLAKGDYTKCMDLLRKLENSQLSEDNRVREMLLYSQLMCVSNLEHRVHGSCSLTLLCQALDVAEKNKLSFYVALVKMHIANLKLTMKMPKKAKELVSNAIETILAHGGCFEQGRAFFLYAKCILASADEPVFDESRKTALKYLDKAKAHFEKVEALGKVKSVIHLQAVVYDLLEMKKERNRCAMEFKNLDNSYSSNIDNLAMY